MCFHIIEKKNRYNQKYFDIYLNYTFLILNTFFVKDIENLLKEKKNVVIVSSGAISLGCKKLNLNKIKSSPNIINVIWRNFPRLHHRTISK